MTSRARTLTLFALAVATLLAGCTGAPGPAGPPAGGDGGDGTGSGDGPGTGTGGGGTGGGGVDPRLDLAPAHRCRTEPAAPANVTGLWFNASFESDAGGFQGDCAFPSATDAVNVTLAGWNATGTDAAAADGNRSLALSLDRGNGTVWVERVLKVPDGGFLHAVALSFRVRADAPDVETVAFAGLRSPYALEHFTPRADGTPSIPGTLQHRGAVAATGEWLTVHALGNVTASQDGLVHVAIGFTAPDAGEGARVLVDDVRVELARRS